MQLKINGKLEDISGEFIREIVNNKGLNDDRIVVEHNMKIVPKEEWENVQVKEGDVIEIVSFVGGG